MEAARGGTMMRADRVGSSDSEGGVEAEQAPGMAGVLGRYHKWAVLALVAVGTFMTALDASIVNIGLPSIARTFRAPVGGAVEWVIIVYLVVIAGTLLTFGRLSDLIMWVPGSLVFLVAAVWLAMETLAFPGQPTLRAPVAGGEGLVGTRSGNALRRT